MPSLSDLTLVTITYNSGQIIGSHLDSLGYESLAPEERPTWIVVDNDSKDNTRLLITEKHSFVSIIANSENVGFGSAANQGIAAAKTRFVVILNPDTQVSPEALTELMACLANDDTAAMAGPNVGDEPMQGREDVEWIIGAAMMMDRSKMDGVGYFDPRFFLYFEETDLCIRAIEKGYRIIHNLAAHMPHVGGGSSVRTPETTYFLSWHYGKSYVHIAEKHPSRFLSPVKYLKRQRRRLWIARLTFNAKRYLLAHSKIAAITGSTHHPNVPKRFLS